MVAVSLDRGCFLIPSFDDASRRDGRSRCLAGRERLRGREEEGEWGRRRGNREGGRGREAGTAAGAGAAAARARQMGGRDCERGAAAGNAENFKKP
ncbi:hypothetical protein ACLOJK_031524 [Asimina triloba]